MDALHLFALALALVLSLHQTGSYSLSIDAPAGPAYAAARIPPDSAATFVRVRLGGQETAECVAGDRLSVCSAALVVLEPGAATLDVESDGAWEVRVYVQPVVRVYLPSLSTGDGDL